MSMSYTSFWLARGARGRRPSFPKPRGQGRTTVAIVGGGLTGCACALSFAQAGVKVVLLEAEAIGQGASGRGPGVVREDFEASFRETVGAHGLTAARSMWQAFRRSSLELATTLRRLNVRCDLHVEDLLSVAERGAVAGSSLHREYQARRAAGLPHTWVAPAAVLRETAVESGGAIRTRGATLDPYRACLGLADAAVRRGAVVHEHARVRRIRTAKKHVEVVTESAVVLADAVLVATADPLPDLRALRRHLKPMVRYAVVTSPLPGAVRRTVGLRAVAVRQDGQSPHMLRWLGGDRALWAGADGPELPARARDKALVQRSGQLMYELSLVYPGISGLVDAEWCWDAAQYDTADHLPFAGLHRNFPRHLFAMGGGRHGAGFAWLAARLLLRAFTGAPLKGDDLFGFGRVL
jgi:glycine/D-amino acid oxidase-like deaminating enzyme